MNEVLKQRLVGALILLALGVIFWPIIFVEPESSVIAQQQVAPPQPQVPTDPIASPSPEGLRGSPVIELFEQEKAEVASEVNREALEEDVSEPPPAPVEPAATVAKKSEPAPAAVRTQSPEPLALDSDGVPMAWILQVVSVSSEQKADELRKRLLDMDHKAYVKRISSSGKTLYRVYIGPKFEQAKLDAIRPQIDAEFGVKSIVRRYVP